MNLDRRQFLRLGTATTLLGGVALLVIAPRGEACSRVIQCGSCDEFAGCRLTKAEQARAQGQAQSVAPTRSAARTPTGGTRA